MVSALIVLLALSAPACDPKSVDCMTMRWAEDLAQLDYCQAQSQHLQGALDASKQLNEALRKDKAELQKQAAGNGSHLPYVVGGVAGGIALTLLLAIALH
jgi:hypothetical protein